jgi:peroxiredoxin
MLEDYAGTPEAAPLTFVGVSPDSPETLAGTRNKREAGKILQLSDTAGDVFRQFHCLDEEALQHGVFLFDSAGQVEWYCISEEPFTDLPSLRREVGRVVSGGATASGR